MKNHPFKIILVLIGIFLLTSSCTPSVESKVKKYCDAGKTIIASTMDQETKNNCIIFADNKGVYFDNMKDVYPILLFAKNYTFVGLGLSMTCEKPSLEITQRVKSFKWEDIFPSPLDNLNNYDIYPIGDWATILCAKNGWGSDYSSYIIKNGNDTIYELARPLSGDPCITGWQSKYQLKYDYNLDAAGCEEIFEYPNCYGNEREESTNKKGGDDEQGFIAIKLEGGYYKLQSDCDNLSSYLERYGQEFYEWYEQHNGRTLYFAELIITPEQFLDVNTIDSIKFVELSTAFKYSELGSTKMYKQLAGALYAKYQKEKEAEVREQMQYILDHCENMKEISDDVRNVFQAEKKYEGKKIYFKTEVYSIKQADEWDYTHNKYRVYAQSYYDGGFSTIEIYCFTDDKQFIELSYPRECVIQGELKVNISSPKFLKFENCKLLMW